MSELRKDPILGRWVIIATERARRPSDFVGETEKPKPGFCPFCHGNEDKTPPEIHAYREAGSLPNTTGWWVRVVPNKFPALQIEGHLDRSGEGIYDRMNGVGAHEVIIETPHHSHTFAEHSDKQVEEILWAFRDRAIELQKDKRLRYILIFKNHGRDAGASLDHPHCQLIAIPIVPKRVKEELDGAHQYYDFKERCVFCDILRQEMASGTRLVEENANFVAFEPFASRFPFETWIMPKRHEAHFHNAQKQDIVDLARSLKRTLSRIKTVLDDPPYNFVLHSTPTDEGEVPHYHWHIEIMPKLTRVAGFEWGSGFYINPMPPEQAAQYLRENGERRPPAVIAATEAPDAAPIQEPAHAR